MSERRRAMRVPVRGEVVLHADTEPLPGSIENLSQTGALLAVAFAPRDLDVELQLRLADHSGWISARTVRVERGDDGVRIAVAFDRVDPALRVSIDASIEHALTAARRRPVLVIDDHADRRRDLIARLTTRGMTPLAPRTPLEAIDLLTRPQLHVDLCLLAPGFGVASRDLAGVLADSFPWVTTEPIDDDVERTAERAALAWATTPVARLGTAIG